jgi:hypothetical protein
MSGPSDDGYDAVRPPDPRMISFLPTSPHGRQWRRPETRSGDPAEVFGDAGVRPFVVTGGRTAPVDDRLRIETQVVTTAHADVNALDFERRRIVELCGSPLSVAEIGAVLRLPLGVARVLVAELAAGGHVAVHESTAPVARSTIERILERVHAL